MSSILTNTGAMTALATLRSVNANLGKTQDEISTGKTVASAKDNAAVWAISKVMESDVAGFKAISDSLDLGDGALRVASDASEKITDLLKNMKQTIVAGQNEGVDRTVLQESVGRLRDQINSIVDGAQFNGVNLLKGSDTMDLLSSLDRSGGNVSVSKIVVDRQDLSMSAGKMGTGAALTAPTVSAASMTNTANTATLTIGGTVAIGDTFTFTMGDNSVSFTATAATVDNVAAGLTAEVNKLGLAGLSAASTTGVLTLSSTKAFEDTALSASDTGAGTTTLSATTVGARAETLTFGTTAVAEGDGYRATIGGANFDYVAGKGETMEDVAKGLKGVIDSSRIAGITTAVKQDTATGQWILQIDNSSATAKSLASANNAKGGTATGGLQPLAGLDVGTEASATSALANIETLIQTSTSAAASFGAARSRVSIQNEFVTSLTDSMKAGIGSLVDADMEETSARLQALQVQQQLAVQSLSIANQAPQSILSLFR